ncbi:penicillin-binding transpeptidase domain-containing protein [Pueribacillus theae]|nr:penicillin-binding transpeptidase domain-containing protein [Pueribacillus theae]
MKIKVPLFLFFILIFSLIGCNKEETPEERTTQFLNSWEKQQFDKMYDQLSADSKKNITKDEFVERYETIYEGIQADKLKLEAKFPEDGVKENKEGGTEVEFSLHMQTIADEVNFTENLSLVKEKTEDGNKWAVHWDPSLIFPSMEEGDKVRIETHRAERGEIVDRSGKGLAVNGKVLNIGIVPERLPEDAKTSYEQLADLIGSTVEDIEKKLNATWVKPDTFVPITKIAKDDKRLNQLMEIKGVTYQEVSARVYPFKQIAAHLTGYVQEINKEELDERKSKGYQTGDLIGKSGLEQVFEDKLRGQNGGRIYIVDKDGTEKDEIANKNAIDGETIALTIDINIQKQVFKQLEGEAGTSAAINPMTGEVLVLASSPSYDPNQFVLGMTSEEWKALNEDPKKPLLNRFASTYPPGSVFKPITGAIALETSAISEETAVNVNGLKWQADNSWGDYYITRVSDPGKPIDLKNAFIYSDNIYFAQAALKIGGQKFLERSKDFGIGEKLPIEYPIETSQLVENSFDSQIQLADSGYGQGKVEMSILHTAISFTPFINEGNLLKPTLLKNGPDSNEHVWKANAIKDETASIINQSLIEVVEHPDGTGKGVKIKGKQMAGKTGTAELKKSRDEKGQENGLFVAYDNENPTLLVAMQIENVEDRGGSKAVVPKVKQIFLETK